MRIVIPTRGRVGRQLTLRGLSPAMRDITTMFYYAEEDEGHRRHFEQWNAAPDEVMIRPADIPHLSAARQYFLERMRERGVERVLILDDDLRFYVRYWRDDCNHGAGDWRLRDATDDEITEWITKLLARMSPEFPHGGFGPRQGNNRQLGGWLTHGGRMQTALAFHVPTALDHADFARMQTRGDFDVTLQLLLAGYPSMITHDFCVEQVAYAKGGCSAYRTLDVSNAAAQRLAEMYPDYVRAVHKEYKSLPRIENVISWRKALKAGIANRERETA